MLDRRVAGDLRVRGAQVGHRQTVHVSVASKAGEVPQLFSGDAEEVSQPFDGRLHFKSRTQGRILSRDTHRTSPSVTLTILLAANGHQCCGPNGDCIRPERQSLGEVGRYSKPACDQQRDRFFL